MDTQRDTTPCQAHAFFSFAKYEVAAPATVVADENVCVRFLCQLYIGLASVGNSQWPHVCADGVAGERTLAPSAWALAGGCRRHASERSPLHALSRFDRAWYGATVCRMLTHDVLWRLASR